MYKATIGLYDADGVRIAQTSSGRQMFIQYDRNLQILPQNRYFSTTPFKEVTFSRVNIADITDDLSVKVDNNIDASNSNATNYVPARIMSVQEWNEWLRNQ